VAGRGLRRAGVKTNEASQRLGSGWTRRCGGCAGAGAGASMRVRDMCNSPVRVHKKCRASSDRICPSADSIARSCMYASWLGVDIYRIVKQACSAIELVRRVRCSCYIRVLSTNESLKREVWMLN